ncbi:MAG: hypothetical protein WCK31_04220, partial [bacterium]
MSKQTAAEWLQECLSIHITDEQKMQFEGLFQQAKAMEKQQIINSFDEGKSDGYKTAREWDEMIIWLSAEQYYNETYNSVESKEMID